jgi:hypothetical protein
MHLLKILSCFFIAIVLFFGFARIVTPVDDFEVSYSGKLHGEFSGEGAYDPCEKGYNTHWFSVIRLFEREDGVDSSSIRLILPSTPPQKGVYAFVPNGDYGKNYSVGVWLFNNGKDIHLDSDDLIEGTLRLKAIPKKPGQRIKGDFDLKYKTQEYGTITIEGKFNVETEYTGEVSVKELKSCD